MSNFQTLFLVIIFRKLYANALMYWLTFTELYPLNLHKDIVIGNELSVKVLQAYDEYIHAKVLPPSSAYQRAKVYEAHTMRLSVTGMRKIMSNVVSVPPTTQVDPGKTAKSNPMVMAGSCLWTHGTYVSLRWLAWTSRRAVRLYVNPCSRCSPSTETLMALWWIACVVVLHPYKETSSRWSIGPLTIFTLSSTNRLVLTCLQCLVRQTSGQTLQEDQLVCSWAGVFMVQKLCTPIERVTSTPACIKGSVLCKGAQQGHPTEAGNVPQQTPSPRKKGIEKVCLHHEDCEEACDEDVQGYEGNEEVGCLLWTSSWTRHWMVPRLWRTWMSRLGIGSILSSPPTIWIYWLHSSQKVVAIACLHFCPTYHLSIAYTTTIGILFFMLHLFVCFISQKYCLSIAGTTPIFLYNLYLFHCFLSA